MNIKTAKYIKDQISGKTNTIFVKYNDSELDYYIPITEDNTDYAEIMKQVDAGELTIEPADEGE